MTKLKFHLAHFFRFMNPGPSPITTLDSYGTHSKGLKRQMFQDTCRIPIPSRGPILTPTVEVEKIIQNHKTLCVLDI